VYQENLVNPKETVKVSVPAILYTIQNNLIYVALANLEATTFQVGYQSKVLTTAVLSVIMLNRKLSKKSWVSLFGLTAGIVMTQIEGSKKGIEASHEGQHFGIGLLSVIACAFCSAFAGVYFEKILKGTNPSVWIRNTQLAFFAVCCGFLTMIVSDGFLSPWGFFQGYDAMVWAIIAVQAAGGLIVAVVVKYADNIMKGFAAALSIVLCGIMSMFLFGFHPSISFMEGSAIVIGATFLYSAPDKIAASKSSPAGGAGGKVNV
jgi:UDP-sugar transporter A1/2/3